MLVDVAVGGAGGGALKALDAFNHEAVVLRAGLMVGLLASAGEVGGGVGMYGEGWEMGLDSEGSRFE